MAQVACQRCGQTSYSVAYWSGTDHCPRCSAELPRPTGITARIRHGAGAPEWAALPQPVPRELPAGMVDSVRSVLRERR
jgi:ribosomal protein S27E